MSEWLKQNVLMLVVWVFLSGLLYAQVQNVSEKQAAQEGTVAQLLVVAQQVEQLQKDINRIEHERTESSKIFNDKFDRFLEQQRKIIELQLGHGYRIQSLERSK